MNLKVKVIFLAKMVLNGAKVPKTLNANFPLQLPHWGSWITGVSWALLKGHPHTSFLRSSLLVELRKFYRAFLNCWSWLADDASRPILAPTLATLGPLLGNHFSRWSCFHSSKTESLLPNWWNSLYIQATVGAAGKKWGWAQREKSGCKPLFYTGLEISFDWIE